MLTPLVVTSKVCLCGVALSGVGWRVVSASYDNTLKVWDVEGGRELRTLAGHSSFNQGKALSADERPREPCLPNRRTGKELKMAPG